MAVLVMAVVANWNTGRARSAEILLRDGRTLSGKLGMISGVAESPKASAERNDPLQLIVVIDDDLRRTYVPKSQVREVKNEEASEVKETFRIRQPATFGGKQVKSVGGTVRLDPFDDFGRRTFVMNTMQGSTEIVQGITEITPDWTRVEGVRVMWDMRIATSSIPHDVLGKILWRQINPKDIEQRKKIARFYVQSERYDDATRELDKIVADFGKTTDVETQLEAPRRALKRLSAQQKLSELRLRRDAGQHQLVARLLPLFPSEGVPGETLQAVREMIEFYTKYESRRAAILRKFDELVLQLKEQGLQAQFRPIREELGRELNINTIERMVAFQQNVDDNDMKPADRLALAVSGWLLGSDGALPRLTVALSAWRVRQMIREYMNEPIQVKRASSLTSLSSEQSLSPQLAAGLLAHMKPPLDTPSPSEDKPGFYELEVPGPPKEPAVRYLVQLPPEYDPHRRYPTLVVLHPEGFTPETQIDWWAGAWSKDGMRQGQATRRGYIVIAPAWMVEHQKEYRYSAREHAAVLDSLRDACRRFSIDTDRVFLSGHSIGGDAAWDLGLAHPDLWAGVIPFIARVDRFGTLYWENGRWVPFYFVSGELDGNRLLQNARDFDRYFTNRFNVTLIEYLGRGHEEFYDEILRAFDWMGRFTRNFYPRDFSCVTMRRTDNFFWWVELNGLPSASMVDPAAGWPPPRGTQPINVKGSLKNNNTLYVQTGASQVTVWISPQLLDISRRVNITINGRRLNAAEIHPKIDVLLEDVRTRGDRQHPFWGKAELAIGRARD